MYSVDRPISSPLTTENVEEVCLIKDYPHPLLWFSDGFGYLHSDGYDYDLDYWQKYQGYKNEMGDKLTEARIAFVKSHFYGKLCDVGIGSGQFVSELGCKGFDINPHAVTWLTEIGAFADPYTEEFEALTFWDVLEHIDDPSEILSKTDNVFMSVPIYANVEECLASKHLRPGEHIWHFTELGLIKFMKRFNFQFVSSSNFETELGRESIKSFYFCK